MIQLIQAFWVKGGIFKCKTTDKLFSHGSAKIINLFSRNKKKMNEKTKNKINKIINRIQLTSFDLTSGMNLSLDEREK